MKSPTLLLIGLITALGVSAALGFRLYQSDKSASDTANLELTHKVDIIETRMDGLSQQLETLIQLGSAEKGNKDNKPTSDLSELEQRLAELEAMQSESEVQPYDQPAEVEMQDSALSLLQENPALYYQQQGQLAEQQQQFIDMAFEVEEIDATWSAGVSTAVQTAFQKPELAAGGQLASVDCRSTMCKLEVLHTTDDANELFLFENHMLIELADQLPSGQVKTIDTAEGKRTVAIMARKGMSLPDFNNVDAGALGFGSGENTLGQ